MEGTISKKIIFDYLSGRITPIERNRVEEWVKQTENQEQYYAWIYEWENNSLQYNADEAAAWNKLESKIDCLQSDTETEEIDVAEKKSKIITDARVIAASLLLLIGGSWLFGEAIMYKTYKTGYGETLEVNLSDGSHAYLNANTSLKVPRFGFGDADREVELKGEADFTVAKTENKKRFIVTASDTVKVEVLGTEFSVFTRIRGTKVTLKSGSVKIDYQGNNDSRVLRMEPGDITSVTKSGSFALAKKQNTNISTAWKEQRYIFDQTPLSEILIMLEENFGVKVKIDDPLIAERTITGNFKTKTADELLKTISQVLDLEVFTLGSTTFIKNH